MAGTVGGEGTERIEALSDGLLAIVLTILVLQFEVPDVAPGELPAAIAAQETLLASYAVSFVVVGVYWVVHHDVFRRVIGHDRVLLWLNLSFLLSISFLPYPTEVLGLYGTRFAWSLYAGTLALVGTTLTAVWAYAAWADLTDDRIDDRTARLLTGRGLLAPAVFLCSIGVATVDLSLAFVTPVAIAPLQWLWTRYYRESADAAGGESHRR